MCRFFSGPVFDHPAVAGLEYYLRLDVDSFLLGPLPVRVRPAPGARAGRSRCACVRAAPGARTCGPLPVLVRAAPGTPGPAPNTLAAHSRCAWGPAPGARAAKAVSPHLLAAATPASPPYHTCIFPTAPLESCSWPALGLPPTSSAAAATFETQLCLLPPGRQPHSPSLFISPPNHEERLALTWRLQSTPPMGRAMPRTQWQNTATAVVIINMILLRLAAHRVQTMVLSRPASSHAPLPSARPRPIARRRLTGAPAQHSATAFVMMTNMIQLPDGAQSAIDGVVETGEITTARPVGAGRVELLPQGDTPTVKRPLHCVQSVGTKNTFAASIRGRQGRQTWSKTPLA